MLGYKQTTTTTKKKPERKEIKSTLVVVDGKRTERKAGRKLD